MGNLKGHPRLAISAASGQREKPTLIASAPYIEDHSPDSSRNVNGSSHASNLCGPTRGPNLEQLQSELQEYVKCLTKIHKEIFTQVKGATEGRTSTIDDEHLKEVLPGDYVYVKTFKRGWSEPRREGPFEVILATPTAVKVKGRKVWIHLNHCSRAPDLLRPVTSAGPDQQQPHIAEDSGAGEQAVVGPSGVSRPITRSIKRATPPDDDDSE
ncbi:hypothetical protein SRHO_G00210410 [Serrasalmus rhombeus]